MLAPEPKLATQPPPEAPAITRRAFLTGALASIAASGRAEPAWTHAVSGKVNTADLGVTLSHEHVLVDFAGAATVSRARYDPDEAFRVVLPHLRAVRAAGCRTLVECTPAFIGRDPLLLRRLSEASGVTILTNTGYYGAGNDKYVPAHAVDASAATLAARWTAEHEDGIEGTGIRPAFIKTGVDAGPLSSIDQKLVRAAALCHRRTGLLICCHSGDGESALGALETVMAEGVAPAAFVWVHAQNEKAAALHLKAARAGAWVSFDGIADDNIERYVDAISAMVRAGQLGRLLISQDAGWYHVGEPRGGTFRPFTTLLERFVPALRRSGCSEEEVQTLLVTNPAAAFATRTRLLAG